MIPLTRAVPITDVDPTQSQHIATTIGEFDRVLGGGLVSGGVILLAGEPGVGKSTLLLEVAARWAKNYGTTLYVSGEESPAQVRMRARRTKAETETLFLTAETDLCVVLGHIESLQPSLVVVDSVQTISSGTEGSPGGVAQVKEVASGLVQVAKRCGIPVIIVGHVTKDGAIAGPRTLEHVVDVVVNFEGDRHSGFRLIRATKNRFGPADEIGCFEMCDTGIVEVPDPSGIFTSSHSEPTPGTAVTVAVEGRRALVAEIQGLVVPSGSANPRRVAQGLEYSRLAMVLAVLQRRASMKCHTMDVYASTVSGARISDPGSDLGLACALASAMSDQPMPGNTVAIGEIGLAGEVRRVADLPKRLAEATRLGVTTAIIPQDNTLSSGEKFADSLSLVEAPTVGFVLNLMDLRRKKKG